MVRLGAIYERGRRVPMNVAQAVDWYNRAAKKKNRGHVPPWRPRRTGAGMVPRTPPKRSLYSTQQRPASRRDAQLGAGTEEGVLVSPDAAKARFWREAAEREASARAGGRASRLKRKGRPKAAREVRAHGMVI